MAKDEKSGFPDLRDYSSSYGRSIENLKKYTYEVETRVKETNKDMERLLKESSLLGKEMMGRVTKSTKNLAFLISDLEESKKALLGETKNSSNRTI